jgi:hypothetical protein
MSKQMRHRRTISALMMLASLVTISAGLRDARAHPDGFVFTPTAFLGDPTPGGGTFRDVFESSFINNHGNVLFGTNVTGDGEQGIFLLPGPRRDVS